MIRRLLILAAAAASLTLPLGAAAQTAASTIEVGGVKFDHSVQVGNAKLQLNGAGVRYKAIFKVYAAGLYLSSKAVTPEAVIAAPGPRLMKICLLYTSPSPRDRTRSRMPSSA